MSYDLIVRSRAEQDIFEAALSYEENADGLGKEFILCVDSVMEQISRNPRIYHLHYKEFRRGLVRRFPYGVFYLISENTVSVARVFSLRQDPKMILRSLK